MANDKNNSIVQENLEFAILKYQDSLASRNKDLMEKCYRNICKLYPPLLHSQEWWNQYHYLFDSREDFEADYIRVFCRVLEKWKPKNKRSKSRYNGTGEFKNYFIGALQHNYINYVKHDNAAKRNPTQKCPICYKWVSPLSTHVMKCHSDLMWEHMSEQGHHVEKLDKCPFCKSHKMPRTYNCAENCPQNVSGGCEKCISDKKIDVLKKHLISKHSSLLFQKFNKLYPNHPTVSPRALSVYMTDQTDLEDNCYYDQIEEIQTLGDLYNIDISDLEKKIIEKVMKTPVRDDQIKVEFDAKWYKCSQDEFLKALDSLRNKMTIVGLEG